MLAEAIAKPRTIRTGGAFITPASLSRRFQATAEHALPSVPVILFAEVRRAMFRALALLRAVVETVVGGAPHEAPRTVCSTVLRKGA